MQLEFLSHFAGYAKTQKKQCRFKTCMAQGHWSSLVPINEFKNYENIQFFAFPHLYFTVPISSLFHQIAYYGKWTHFIHTGPIFQ